MNTTLNEKELSSIFNNLEKANASYSSHFPGESSARQPVHTVYGGAHLFKSTLTQRLSELALRSLDEYGGDFVTFAKAIGLSGSETLPQEASMVDQLSEKARKDIDSLKNEHEAAWLAWLVYDRVKAKLQREAVEDFRIDFEDGFGNRPDDEEDAVAVQAAREVAKGMRENSLSPFIGIRIKPFNEELKKRSARTLDIFITALWTEMKKLPENFIITIPKIPIPEQITAVVECLERLEKNLGIPEGELKVELMIELTQTLVDESGRVNIPLLLKACRGRCRGAHFGTYDYTASCNITAAYQSMMHPSCDFARQMMIITLANTGVMLSDGATNVMPIGPNRPKDRELSSEEKDENIMVVHRAWRLAYDHIMHSLKIGFYQGWDLHPAQLPIRYAAMYNFFLEGLESASERLKNFIQKAAQATLVGDVFDDAATGQGLLNFFLRALACGAVTEAEILETGLTIAEIRGRSFVKILESRKGA